MSTEKRHIFCKLRHILSGLDLTGGNYMRECDDTTVDLDDLIFGEEEWSASQR